MSLLAHEAHDGESEELEEASDNCKTLGMPAAILEVLKKPATNWKTLEMSKSLEELEKADNDIGDLVDAAGNTGGLEELADAWRFSGSWSQQTTALWDISALWNE